MKNSKIIPFISNREVKADFKKGFEIENNADTATIYLYDEIGGWGTYASEVIQELEGITASNILVRINSPGGSVFEGLAIYNVLKDHPANIKVKVDGMAASIASVILLAADEIEVASNALVMIHRAMSMTFGTVDEIMEDVELLEKVEKTILKTYEERTKLSQEEALALMSVGTTNSGTWLNAEEAMEIGFATKQGEEMKIAAKFTDLPFRDAPKNAFEMLKEPEPEEEQLEVDASEVDALLSRTADLV